MTDLHQPVVDCGAFLSKERCGLLFSVVCFCGLSKNAGCSCAPAPSQRTRAGRRRKKSQGAQVVTGHTHTDNLATGDLAAVHSSPVLVGRRGSTRPIEPPRYISSAAFDLTPPDSRRVSAAEPAKICSFSRRGSRAKLHRHSAERGGGGAASPASFPRSIRIPFGVSARPATGAHSARGRRATGPPDP